MNTKSGIDQAEEVAPRTLKEIVHEEKTLGPEASVQEACDELRSQGMTSSPVTDKDGQLLGTVLLRILAGCAARGRRIPAVVFD